MVNQPFQLYSHLSDQSGQDIEDARANQMQYSAMPLDMNAPGGNFEWQKYLQLLKDHGVDKLVGGRDMSTSYGLPGASLQGLSKAAYGQPVGPTGGESLDPTTYGSWGKTPTVTGPVQNGFVAPRAGEDERLDPAVAGLQQAAKKKSGVQ